MRSILILLGLLFFMLNANAQSENNRNADDRTVSLLVFGKGKTVEEAKQNALRSAIEQAFGTFISSNTTILNDRLVKDEIVSVSNGNIQRFDIISEVKTPDGSYATSLQATVSVNKLISFIESKGAISEFKGSLFAFNVNQQLLNEINESKAIKELTSVTLSIIGKSFYGTILPKDPFLKRQNSTFLPCKIENGKILAPDREYIKEYVTGDNIYSVPYEIEIHANENINTAVNYFLDNLNKISLTNNQVDDYIKLNKPVYEVILAYPNSPISGEFTYNKKYKNSSATGSRGLIALPDYDPSKFEFHSIYLRNKTSYDLLVEFIDKSYEKLFKFKINTNSNLVLKLTSIEVLKSDYRDDLLHANGLIPFAQSGEEIREGRKLPIIIPDPDYLCEGSSLNNPGLPRVNKDLAKYLCKRKYYFLHNPFLLLLIHKYQKNGLVYQLFGSFDVSFSDLGKITSFLIDYSK